MPRDIIFMVAASKCSNVDCKTPDYPVKSGWCTSGACKRRRAEQRSSGKLVAGCSRAAFIEEDGMSCFEVHAVYGVSRCDISVLGPMQRRNKLSPQDERWSYEVFGRFAENAEENGKYDTRKVPLKELLKTVDEESLDMLEAFDRNIKKKIRAAKTAMLEKAAAEEEEEADVAVLPASEVEVGTPADTEPASPEEATAS